MSGMPTNWADESDSDGEDIPRSHQKEQKPAPIPAAPARQQQQATPAQSEAPRPAKPQHEINPNGPFILFVGNLTFEVTEDDLGNFFYNGGCDVVDVKVQTDRETGRSRGFAHVEVRDLPSMQKGLTASGHEFMGRRLNVDVGKAPHRQERRGADRDKGFARRGGSRDRNRDRGTRPTQERDNAPIERGLRVERTNRSEKARTPKGADDTPAPAVPAAVPERKKLEIKPRSVPIGQTIDASQPSSYNSIFGDAKPRDEKVVEKKSVDATLPVPPVEKMEELKVSPPAAPTDVGTEDKKNAGDKKDRRPTKPTWSEARAPGRGEGRGRGEAGRGERRDVAGRGRGGRGDRPERADKGPRPARDSKPSSGPKKGDRKAETVEEKGKSSRPVNALSDAVESQKAASKVQPKQVNMFAGLDGDSDSEED